MSNCISKSKLNLSDEIDRVEVYFKNGGAFLLSQLIHFEIEGEYEFFPITVEVGGRPMQIGSMGPVEEMYEVTFKATKFSKVREEIFPYA